MQIDLHHSGTYVLCRNAGMKSEYAEIVAYAAQQVDDATHGHALAFENGEVFKQTLTAHKGLKTSPWDFNVAMEVWVPFHFLPQGLSASRPDSMATAPNSPVLHQLLTNILEVSCTPLALYRLGIGMHVFADTFTHQNFKGFFDRVNDIALIQKEDSEGIFFKRLINQILNIMAGGVTELAPIGHLQALSYPDVPNAVWSYKNAYGEMVQINNLEERYLPALEAMYEYLCEYVRKNPQFRSHTAAPRPFHMYRQRFRELLSHEGSIEERHEFWLKQIHTNAFGWEDFSEIDRNLGYHHRAWFKDAVEAVRRKSLFKLITYKTFNYYEFTKKSDFNNSNWVKFMQAAAEHKYKVIHQILPNCGLMVG